MLSTSLKKQLITFAISNFHNNFDIFCPATTSTNDLRLLQKIKRSLTADQFQLIKSMIEKNFSMPMSGELALLPPNELFNLQLSYTHKMVSQIFVAITIKLEENTKNLPLFEKFTHLQTHIGLSSDSPIETIIIDTIKRVANDHTPPDISNNEALKQTCFRHFCAQSQGSNHDDQKLSPLFQTMLTTFSNIDYNATTSIYQFTTKYMLQHQHQTVIAAFIKAHVKLIATTQTIASDDMKKEYYTLINNLSFYLRKLSSLTSGVISTVYTAKPDAISPHQSNQIGTAMGITYSISATLALLSFILATINYNEFEKIQIDAATLLNGAQKANLVTVGITTTVLSALSHPMAAAIVNAICTVVGFGLVIGTVVNDFHDKDKLEKLIRDEQENIHANLKNIEKIEEQLMLINEALKILQNQTTDISDKAALDATLNKFAKLIDKNVDHFHAEKLRLNQAMIELVSLLMSYEKRFGSYDVKGQLFDTGNTLVQVAAAIIGLFPHAGLIETIIYIVSHTADVSVTTHGLFQKAIQANPLPTPEIRNEETTPLLSRGNSQ